MSKASRKEPPQFREGYKLPSFLKDSAFALRTGMVDAEIPLERSAEAFKDGRRSFRLKAAVLAAIVVVMSMLSLCLGYSSTRTSVSSFIAPWDALANLWNWAAWQISHLLSLGWFDDQTGLLQVAPDYAQVVPRAGMTLATLVCGALLACAGMLYQTVFRNPIASPSLLGVTHGVQVGLVMVFATYGITASSALLIPQRFLYGYVGGMLALAVMFALSRLIAKRREDVTVFDMLVIGTILSAFLGAVRDYNVDMISILSLWTEYYEYQEGLNLYSEPVTYIILFASVAVCFIPVVLLRFRLNLLSFDDGEVRIMGGHPRALRILSIIAGSVMILTAQVFVGSASCFALVIPFLARYLFGSEFRGQLWGNVLLGMIVLLLCRDLICFIPFPGMLPIGAVAGAITMPIFVWASAFSKKGW